MVQILLDGNRARILLATTGSIGSKDVGKICELLSGWAEVRVVASASSLAFIKQKEVEVHAEVLTDESEWYSWRSRGDKILHIELRNWADVMIIAPLTANTLAKIVNGICDNLLTTVFRAWQANMKPILVAPSMNKYMWEHPITALQLEVLRQWGIGVVPPREKLLAGGDFGLAAMALPTTIAEHVQSACCRRKIA